jgi:hypothetical protein
MRRRSYAANRSVSRRHTPSQGAACKCHAQVTIDVGTDGSAADIHIQCEFHTGIPQRISEIL